MKSIKVYGKEYPMRITMGAMRRFKRATGKDISQTGSDIDLLATFMWCCVASACNADGVPFDLDADKFADGLDLEDFNQFQESMSGDAAGDASAGDVATDASAGGMAADVAGAEASGGSRGDAKKKG